MTPSIDQQIQILSRRCERFVTEEELRQKLKRSYESGKPLRVKFGMDPTAPDVTLGHVVPLKIIRQFQEWGHKAVLIIGDYTARVGDPTGRNETRPQLTGEEIDTNAKTYVAQVGKILLTDPAHLEVRFNGEWLGKMGMVDIIRLASQATVAQMLTRDDFAKRYAEGVEIRMHEILYPLLQGWDSVMIDADIEMGGSDQLFNNMVGRELQKNEGKEGQLVIVTPLLVGTDGHIKMSKSKGNYIAVTDPPGGATGIFGKVMSIPDRLMESYFQLLTDLPMDEVRQQIADHPRDAKIRLAKHLISWLHDQQSAEAAEAEFITQFVNKKAPDEMPEFLIGPGLRRLTPLLVQAGLASSNGEAMRKIKEGAVSIEGEKVTDPQKQWTFDHPVAVRLGRRYARLTP